MLRLLSLHHHVKALLCITITLVGGRDGSTFYPDMWTYDGDSNVWVNITGISSALLPPAQAYLASAVDTVAHRTYLIGGNASGGAVDTTLLFGENTTESAISDGNLTSIIVNSTGSNTTGLILRNTVGYRLSDVDVYLMGASSTGLEAYNTSEAKLLLQNVSINATENGARFYNVSLAWTDGMAAVTETTGFNLYFNGSDAKNVTSVEMVSPLSNTRVRILISSDHRVWWVQAYWMCSGSLMSM